MITTRNQLAFGAFALPLLVGALFAWLSPPPASPGIAAGLDKVDVNEASELEAVFSEFGYEWPPSPAGGVPPIAVRSVPVDIAELPVAERKRLFFRIIAPLVAVENRQLREQREFLRQTFEAHSRLPEAGAIVSRVRKLASRFNVAGDLDDPEVRQLLLRRVDIVPVALVLAQAANESGWGTSRFTREANNLFGMWTWDESAGLAPRDRDADASHFVRVFDSLQEAVGNYLHTINVGRAYGELRDLRAAQRARNTEPDAMTLAGGLLRYSARGEEYVGEIRSIIQYNELQKLPPLELRYPAGQARDGTLPAGR